MTAAKSKASQLFRRSEPETLSERVVGSIGDAKTICIQVAIVKHHSLAFVAVRRTRRGTDEREVAIELRDFRAFIALLKAAEIEARDMNLFNRDTDV